MADTNLEKEMEALRADLAKVRSDLAGLFDAVKEVGKQRAKGVRDSVSHLAETLGDDAADTFERARDRGRKSVDCVEHSIGANPVLSLLIALGVGALVGKLLERR